MKSDQQLKLGFMQLFPTLLNQDFDDSWLFNDLYPKPCQGWSSFASDALDDAILKKLNGARYATWFADKEFTMIAAEVGLACSPDKKMCRALFAKKLFSLVIREDRK